MEALIFVDTHILIAIAAGAARLLSQDAKRALEKAQGVYASPMAVLELHFLSEIGRLRVSAAEIMRDAQANQGVAVLDRSLFDVTTAAAPLTWARDPFDRMIVAHAALENAPLVTKDTTILAHYPRAVW